MEAPNARHDFDQLAGKRKTRSQRGRPARVRVCVLMHANHDAFMAQNRRERWMAAEMVSTHEFPSKHRSAASVHRKSLARTANCIFVSQTVPTSANLCAHRSGGRQTVRARCCGDNRSL